MEIYIWIYMCTDLWAKLFECTLPWWSEGSNHIYAMLARLCKCCRWISFGVPFVWIGWKLTEIYMDLCRRAWDGRNFWNAHWNGDPWGWDPWTQRYYKLVELIKGFLLVVHLLESDLCSRSYTGIYVAGMGWTEFFGCTIAGWGPTRRNASEFRNWKSCGRDISHLQHASTTVSQAWG